MELDFQNTAKRLVSMDAYFLDIGMDAKGTGYYVKCTSGFSSITQLDLIDRNIPSAPTVAATVNAAQIKKFFGFFGAKRGYTKGTYRKVKTNAKWRSAYGVYTENFTAYDLSWMPMIKSEEAVACRICRTVIPLRMVTVDHQHPQSGGGYLAIARVFRAMGLTRGAPHGRKNMMEYAKYSSKAGGVSSFPGTRADRRTLNPQGAIYYTVLRHAGKIPDLAEACMHHYVNLRPVCGPCNSTLSNHNVF